MELRSKAEMNLVAQLHKKMAKTASTYLKQARELAGDDENNIPISKRDLKQYRSSARMQDPTQADHDEQEWIMQVQELEERPENYNLRNDHATGPVLDDDSRGLSQIELNAIVRRDRHLQAQQQYADHVRAVSEEIEGTIIKAADVIKDTLASIDGEICAAERDLENEGLLLASEHHAILLMWEKMEAICQKRTSAITKFEQQLEQIEQTRATRVKEGLQELTEVMMDTAYALPPEVERIIEAEAYELNVVLISNRCEYADLIARMSIANVDVFVNSRLQWEEGQKRWRQLRHNQAIQNFHATMNSPVFVDPEERKEVLANVREFQRHIHDSRLVLLKQLQQAGESLSSEQAKTVLTGLSNVQNEEEEENQAFFRNLFAIHEDKIKAAQSLREALRLELHGFGALAKEGDVTFAREELVKLMTNTALDEFFRMAGGLRTELETIVKKLNTNELIYQANVSPLMTSLSVLLSALPLERVMEAQGKGAERKAVQTTLEKLRKAAKSEMTAFLPALQTQIGVLANLADMDQVFKAELEEIALQLDQIIRECAAPSVTSDSHASRTGSAGPASPAYHERRRLSTSQTALLSAATASASASGSASVTSPSKQTTLIDPSMSSGQHVDLQAIRRVQRRLGTLVYASELSSDFQAHLQFVADQLQLQTRANAVLDEVVARECEHLLAHRQEESLLFLEQIGKRIENQATGLHEQCEKMVRFFIRIATCMEQSADKINFVNLSIMDVLDHLKDSDDENNELLERQYTESCARLRHAPNDAVLEEEFHISTELLKHIEAEYRLYHQRVSLGCSNHTTAIDSQIQYFLHMLCEFFGLEPPTPAIKVDLEQLLSAKVIEDTTRPVPVASPGENNSNPNEAPADSSAAPQPAAAPPQPTLTHATRRPSKMITAPDHTQHHDASHAHTKPYGRNTPQPHDTAPKPPPKPTFKTELGLSFNVILLIPQLVERILAQKDAEEVDPMASRPTTSDAGLEVGLAVLVAPSTAVAPPVLAPAPANTGAAATQPVAQDAQSTVPPEQPPTPVDEEQLRQQAERKEMVLGQVQREFLAQEITAHFMEDLVSQFRSVMLSKYDREARQNTTATSETRRERVEDANLLLEDRLRLHWPRKGRLDVQFYQPRVGELVNHRQRRERHIRNIFKKLDTQEQLFAKNVEDCFVMIEQVRGKQLVFQTQLPLQQSLAALQGLEVKSKKLLSGFRSEITDKVNALLGNSTADLNTLLNSAQDYVRVCTAQLFPDLTSNEVISGCDYHPLEIDWLKEKLVEVERQVRERVAAREVAMKQIHDKQHQALELGKTFKTRYQSSLQTLSMREGLGQKYGLPRRTLQERYRTETTRCDEASDKIHQLLHDLQTAVDTRRIVPVKTAKPMPLSELPLVVLTQLVQLRAKIYNRGAYFGFLKNASQLEVVPVEYTPSAEPKATYRDRELVDEEDLKPPTPFLDYVKQIMGRFRDDTKQLYLQEGKTDDLPPSGIPEALEEYLTELNDRARAYVFEQEEKYREQVDHFGELLAVAPEVALSALVDKSQRDIMTLSESLSTVIDAQFADSLRLKDQHTLELRPDLCSTNNLPRLQELCDREKNRSEALQHNLRAFRAQVLEGENQVSATLEKDFVALFRAFVVILDSSIVSLDDLKPFSGEELPKAKRKSLKRLRKLARIQEVGDPREVKRTDKELEKLKQLGEVPRYPKRAWSSIPSFGMYAVWAEEKTRIQSDDERDGSARDGTLAALLCEKPTTIDDGTCVTLLTHCHRCLVHARDELYAAYTVFCREHSRRVTGTAQERLRDEIKWTQSWRDGIQRMQRQQAPQTNANNAAPKGK
ncbi:TPA: hypothetical protein N0F65_006637 [Lagenidium giganteum]|uniref:Uncharacterized protein n=1 Tax=Lagenidium giganteum TaxID=4803 RepID=A0AAV2ZBV7_9STRA|nr:TPA: hypothetical protein N0F65_006637 [Lagenidium giganteum]